MFRKNALEFAPWIKMIIFAGVTINGKVMAKMTDVSVGIKKLDFTSLRGKMAAYLTDGREIIVPLSFFPDIKQLSKKEREKWMILDDQFFSFERLSKVYSIGDLMRLS